MSDAEKPEPPKIKRRFDVTFLGEDGVRYSVGDSITSAGAMRLATDNRNRMRGGYWQIHDRLKDVTLNPFPFRQR